MKMKVRNILHKLLCRKFCSCKDKFTFASSVVKQTNKQNPTMIIFSDKQVIPWYTAMQVCCSVSSLGYVSIRASWITTRRLFPIITFIAPVGSPVRLTGPFTVLSSSLNFSFCFLQINSHSMTRWGFSVKVYSHIYLTQLPTRLDK